MSKYNRRKTAAGDGGQNPPAQDEFVGFWQKVFNKITPHLSGFVLLLVGGVVAWFALWGVGQYTTGRKEASSETLAEAIRTYQAELLGDKETPSTLDDVVRYKTAKERADATLSTLDKLDKEYGSSDAAVRGDLARAGVLYDLARYDDAEVAYKKFLGKKPKDAALLALAREGLGLCDEARGKPDAALAIYQEGQEPQQGNFYIDRFLLDQARIYAKKGDKKKAVELYKEILAKSPQSPMKDDVNNHIIALEQ